MPAGGLPDGGVPADDGLVTDSAGACARGVASTSGAADGGASAGVRWIVAAPVLSVPPVPLSGVAGGVGGGVSCAGPGSDGVSGGTVGSAGTEGRGSGDRCTAVSLPRGAPKPARAPPAGAGEPPLESSPSASPRASAPMPCLRSGVKISVREYMRVRCTAGFCQEGVLSPCFSTPWRTGRTWALGSVGGGGASGLRCTASPDARGRGWGGMGVGSSPVSSARAR